MKKVDQSFYDKKYFDEVLKSLDFSKEINENDFGHIYRTMAKISDSDRNSLVIDIGCGNGELCFYLSWKVGCEIIGIDYSKDAIAVCEKNLSIFKNSKNCNPNSKAIQFINSENEAIKKFDNATSVFLIDVVEHLYDEELKLLFEKIGKWNNNLKIFIHTDNNLFLYCIRPFLDFMSIMISRENIKEIKKRNKFEKERHINLTNPLILKRKMKKWGFIQEKLFFSEMTEEKIVSQLGPLSKFKFIIWITKKVLKFFKFLSPSFYAIYKKNFNSAIKK